jgi:hypothetical protein
MTPLGSLPSYDEALDVALNNLAAYEAEKNKVHRACVLLIRVREACRNLSLPPWQDALPGTLRADIESFLILEGHLK